ncbi:MAG: peptide ABC transporter substrate-binding protein [Pseudomonadota bacterium]
MQIKKISFPVLILLMLFAVSCTKKDEMKEVFYYAMNGDIPNLDPIFATDMNSLNVVYDIFEGLTAYNPKNLAVIEAVASSWEISNDKRKYTFHIRKEAKWSNGDELTAEDFKKSWLRAIDPKLKVPYAYYLHYIKNAREYNQGLITNPNLVGIKTEGKLKLIVELAKPTTFFLELTAFPVFFPVPMDLIKKHKNKWTLAHNIISNGAFKLSKTLPVPGFFAEKNKHYYNAKEVYLKGVKYFALQNGKKAYKDFMDNKYHKLTIVPQIFHEEASKLKEFRAAPISSTMFLLFNTKSKALSQVSVRRALMLAIDKELIVKNVLKSNQMVAHSFVPPIFKDYTSPANETYSPKRAKYLFKRAGFSQGKNFPKIIINYTTLEMKKDVLNIIVKGWKEILGIDVTIQNMTRKEFFQKLGSLDYDVAMSEWFGDYLDPLAFLELFISNSGNNNTGWASSIFDSLILTANNQMSDKLRINLLQQAEELLLKDAPIIPLFHGTKDYLLKSNIKGVYDNPIFYQPCKYITIE